MTNLISRAALFKIKRVSRRGRVAIAMLASLLAAPSYSQLAIDKSGIQDGTYWNADFGFSYRWPVGMTPVTLHLKEPGGPPNDYRKQESLLFAARQDHQLYGVVVLAEPVGIATPKFAPWKGSKDFIHRLPTVWDPQKQWKILRKTATAGSTGMVFDELDYSFADETVAILATQIGDHLIVFKCNSPSPSVTASIVQTVLDTKRIEQQ